MEGCEDAEGVETISEDSVFGFLAFLEVLLFGQVVPAHVSLHRFSPTFCLRNLKTSSVEVVDQVDVTSDDQEDYL